MTYQLVPPDDASIHRTIAEHLPHLAHEAIESLGAGWAFWAYRVGDKVLRFPRDAEFTHTLAVEAAVMRELAPTLPLPVAVIDVHEGGPGGLPFTGHRFVPGVPVVDLPRQLAPGAGSVLGEFIRAMHSFPVERAAALGLPKLSPPQRQAARRSFFSNEVVRRIFSLLTNEGREHVRATFRAFLENPSHFDWQPVVTHCDIDARNVLADPETGELTGVIDWGDLSIADPAGDFIDAQNGGLARFGLSGQLNDLFKAYGITRAELETMQPRCDFYKYCWPLHEIIYGLNSHDDDVVQKGIEALEEKVHAPGP